MPTPTEHFPLPLDLLIGRLEAAGFRVDTSRRLRVLRVFDDLGNPFVGGHFEELKYLLSPLVSRSPQEQERFYEVFDAFWRECEAEAQQVEAAGVFAEGEKKVDEVRVLAKPKKRWRWAWVAAASVVGATVTGMLLWTMAHQDMAPTYVISLSAVEGDTLRGEVGIEVSPHSIFGIQLPVVQPKSFFNWEVRDSSMETTLHQNTGRLAWVVSEKAGRNISVLQKTTIITWLNEVVHYDTFKVEITCSDPPKVPEIIPSTLPPYVAGTEYEFTIKTEPGSIVVLEDMNGGENDTFTVGVTGQNIFRLRTGLPGENTTVNAITHRHGEIGHCYNSTIVDITVGTNKPILPLTPFQRDQSFSVFVISRLGWLVILLPLLLAGWFFYRWRKKRNTPAPQKTPEELADQYPVLDAGPYFIPYRSQEHSITVPREFFRIAEMLRRREEGQRRYFDGPATVRATVESGGFPAWRERAVTRPAEYLFLVERPDERDQQGKLFTRLCDFLKRRDVPLVTFFHDGSFQHFWNAEYADGLPPLELRRRYPHHRLVLVGAAHGLVNLYATRQPELLRGPLDWLTHWPRRLLLTPEPVAAWSFQEALLHRHFLVFPADTEGILSGIDLLDRTEEYHPGRFERWQDTRAPRHRPETHRYRTWKTAADHADYLRHDPDCFRWLCALAVCAQPDWSLTLALGRAIGVELTHDRLLLLTRIPWLSQNQPNDGLRLELLRQLSPADEQAARAAVAHELEAVRSVTANSFAETERTANAAVQNFALDPCNEAHKQAIRELRTLGLLSGSQEAELDFIVQEKADKSGLPNSAGAGIASWLEAPAPKRFWTKDMDKGLLSVLLSAIFAIALLLVSSKQEKPLPKPFDWLTEDVAQSADVMQWNERAIEIAERALAVEDYQQWLGLRDSLRLADSLFQLVAKEKGISVRTLGSASLHAHNLGINLPIFRYNVSAKKFNFYQTEALTADTLRRPLRGFESAQASEGWRENFAVGTRLDLDAQHGQGLCYYYLSRDIQTQIAEVARASAQSEKDVTPAPVKHSSLLDSAKIMLGRIRAQEAVNYYYFDSIQATMPVNLQTLLEAEGVRDKGDPADTDEALRQKILGHWVGAVGSWKALTVFGKDGTATMQTYNSANKLMQTASGRWSVENKTLLLEQSDVTKSRITHLDNNRLTLDDGTTKPPTFRRIQPTDRDRDGVLDVVDNCPDEKGGAENAGCPEESKGPTVVVSAVHKLTKDPLYGVAYRLIEIGGKGAVEEKTSTQGESSVQFRLSGSRYKILATKSNFSMDSVELSTVGWSGGPLPAKILYLIPELTEDFIPPVLYFDNDQPDPNSIALTTKQAYQTLYIAYLRRKEEYIRQYTAGLGKEAMAGATDSVETFFDRDVRGGWERMFAFSEALYEMLADGSKIELTLRGYTAPRGSSNYNMALSKRRIGSVVNHFLTFDGAILKKFVDNGQLTLIQEPNGESKAPRGISDNEKDLRRSVYSPEAARQNRVEIIEVEVRDKSKN